METKIEKKQKTEVVGNSPAEMIRMAVSGGADLEKLNSLLDLQMKWEQNEARKAYHRAMSDFKANPPKILKDRTVSYGAGKASYRHASLANVCAQINEALSKHGLSASWKTSQNGQVMVTCKITHSMGHSEETTLAAPSDTSGSKNAIQAIGSTITYLERYTLLALVGLATEDMDDDGIASGRPLDKISESQIGVLLDLIIATKTDQAKFLTYMKVDAIENIPASAYQKAFNALQTKAERGAK